MDDICDLSLCLDATYLAFEGKIYQQVHGTVMGSPVSVVVANLVMEDIEQPLFISSGPCGRGEARGGVPAEEWVPLRELSRSRPAGVLTGTPCRTVRHTLF